VFPTNSGNMVPAFWVNEDLHESDRDRNLKNIFCPSVPLSPPLPCPVSFQLLWMATEGNETTSLDQAAWIIEAEV
jgi:hypothetical protein